MDQSFLERAKQSFQKELEKIKDIIHIRHTRVNFGILIFWILAIVLGFVADSLYHSEPFIALASLFFSSILCFTYFLFGKSLYEYKIRQFCIRMTDILSKLQSIFAIFEDDAHDIYDVTSQITMISDITDSLKYMGKRKIQKFFPETIANIIKLLDLCQKDLYHQIDMCKSQIELGKSELSKNISSIPEFHEVAQVQKTRLDRQIEQFEELQRVLMRL